MKITIFGLAGTGTSTIGKLLAKKLNYSFNSTGNLMREKAKELNLSIYEFDKLCKKDSSHDISLDKNVKKFGKENDNFIFESRLAWYFISDSIKIILNCDKNIVFERIAKRENISVEYSKKITNSRAKNLRERYSTFYPKIKYPPKNDKFDLVIDTSSLSIDEILEKIVVFLNSIKK